jgi:mRNA interferase MazF
LATSIERGDVLWVDFEPSLGGEIKKTRPAVVVSNNTANTHLNRVQVVPITSNTDRLYPGEAFVSLNGEKRKAMADQLTTVSKQRLGSRIGVLNVEDIARVETAIAVQLALNLK